VARRAHGGDLGFAGFNVRALGDRRDGQNYQQSKYFLHRFLL